VTARTRRVEVPPERLEAWVQGFAGRHGAVLTTRQARAVRLAGADGAVAAIEVPFPPLPEDASLVGHAMRPRRVGLVLVRRGGFAAGIAEGGRLSSGRTGTRHVQGRSAAGGWSQQRFARRRARQTEQLVAAATRLVVDQLVPEVATLDGVLTGGDRLLLRRVLAADAALPLAPLLLDRLLEVPDPRRAVLEEAAARARFVVIDVTDPV
jgi:Actinobacteria/chloroflexi VLRF1 release factor